MRLQRSSRVSLQAMGLGEAWILGGLCGLSYCVVLESFSTRGLVLVPERLYRCTLEQGLKI
jgi:hypothetical protein